MKAIPAEVMASSIRGWIAELEEVERTGEQSAVLGHCLAGMRQAVRSLDRMQPAEIVADDRGLTVTRHSHIPIGSRGDEV